VLARIRKAMEEREEGFTLIELLVVIIIIGILAAIAIPVFLNQRKKGVDASIKSDLRTIANEEETLAVDGTAYSTAPNVQKTSANNHFAIGVNSNGYCIKGFNTNSSATGDATTGNGYWYDSMAGGLQSGAATSTAPTGGVCAAVGAANLTAFH
jgi:prepilin-type N-terminal cleavage/methylation domain-containing protein